MAYTGKHFRRTSLWRKLGKLFFVILLIAGIAAGILLFAYPQRLTQLGEWFTQAKVADVFEAEQTITVPDPVDEPADALCLSIDAVQDGTALNQIRAAGCDGVVLDMKTASGDLNYVSRLPLAVEAGASAADPTRNEALQTFNRTPDLYTIARVSYLRDEKLADCRPSLAITRPSGSLWRDTEGLAWLRPGKDQAEAYLTGICQELSALGFDEILLADTTPPSPTQETGEWTLTAGNFEKDNTDFLQTLRGELAKSGTRLSIIAQDFPAETQAQPEKTS